jgi:hypothetical protein
MGGVSNLSASTQGSNPATPDGMRAFVVTPFHRLARTHAASAMADAMVAAALADSLFFSLPADSARAPVVRYLLITMLPFAVIAPLVGPLIDRLKGGHRFVLIGTAIARAVLCYLMIDQIRAGGAPFFLLALCVLVSQRAYHVARSALVPTVVSSDDELVEANSKLAIISGISSFVGVLPAALLIKVWGPGWALGLAMTTYLVASVLGSRIPAARIATSKADETERHELRGAGIVLAGSAMGLLRMCVGFLTLLIAFDFRGGDRRPWEFAVVGGASVLSQLAGAALAPRLKERTSEENILTGALGLVVVGAFLSLLLGEVLGASILGACVGFAAGSGKLAFDSILQRDAPDANRGRSFARFETRFQVTYVIGAFIPVAIDIGARAGFAIVFVMALFATASYVVGRLAWAHRSGTRQTAATAAAVEIETRFAEVSGEVRGRLAAAPRSLVTRFRSTDDAPPVVDDSVDDPTRAVDDTRAGASSEHGGVDATVVERPPHLAGDSPVAWTPPPPPPVAEFPWEVPTEPAPPPSEYLADVDPSVTNPYPWTPDDVTRAETDDRAR